MVDLANREDPSQEVRRSIQKSVQSVDAVIKETTKVYGVSPEDYHGFCSIAAGRDVAAYLSQRYTTATLAELSSVFGLLHRDSSGDLVRRAKSLGQENASVARRIGRIEKRLSLNPESRV